MITERFCRARALAPAVVVGALVATAGCVNDPLRHDASLGACP